MRTLIARLTVAGLFGIAVAGCGTNSGSIPPGASPNGNGGAPGGQGGGGAVSNQAPPGGSALSFLIDGGVVTPTSTYTGYNVSGVKDTQSTADAGTDTAGEGSSVPPTNPPGSHSITFTGNNKTQLVFAYSGTVGKGTGQNGLLLPVVTTGQIQPITYGSIVLFAYITPATIPPSTESPTISVELVGGSGAEEYDVRANCATDDELGGSTLFDRYVCDLPAYGSASGSYTTKYSTASGFSASTVAGTIANSASGGAGGAFTPSASEAPSLYVVLNYPGLSASTSIG
ncbi:MAG: hypothetical protein IAI50_04375, partial [Candidatus Eremiobacteraeota bacterium]|nr:hypothetical protein [Candidatus Eremiobacteraeota bacterium]